MTMERNNRNYHFDPNGGNGRDSFQEHNEYMRWFRKAHADVAWSNKPRCSEFARLDSILPLQVSRSMMETGGSRFLSGVTDWSALVPILKVARYKLSQN